MKTLIRSSVLMFALLATTWAQTIWPKKPYTDWSLDDVTRILSDSQWTRTDVRSVPTTYRPDSPDRPPATEFFVHLRLYSALPVRQAIVRRMQLTIPYDKLMPLQRASFDAEVDGLLRCPHCADYYIITLTSAKNQQLSLATRGNAFTLDVVALLKNLPEEELLRHVSLLNDKGERRNAMHVVFTQREMVLLFPRRDDRGISLITTTNKKFTVDFDDYLSKKVEGALSKFTFEVGDLVRDGVVVF